jgi:hypothetical protein
MSIEETKEEIAATKGFDLPVFACTVADLKVLAESHTILLDAAREALGFVIEIEREGEWSAKIERDLTRAIEFAEGEL